MQGDSERLSVGGFPAFICPCLILRSAVMPPACAAEYQITRNAALRISDFSTGYINEKPRFPGLAAL